MEKIKEGLLQILNQALEFEHTAKIQYSTRSEMIASALAEIERAHQAKGVKEIMEINLKDEKEAIVFYKWMRNKVGEHRAELQDAFERLEGGIRNVIHEEQKYLKRLTLFVEQLEERVEKKRRPRCSRAAEGVCAIK